MTFKDAISQLRPSVFFGATWRTMDADAAALRQYEGDNGTATTAYIYLVGIFCLIASDINYLGGAGSADTLLRFLIDPQTPEQHPVAWMFLKWIAPGDDPSKYYRWVDLWYLSYWAVVKLIAYLVIPAIAIWIHPRLQFSDVGLGTSGMVSNMPLYLLLFVPVFVVVVGASFFPEFNQYYPFYSHVDRSVFDFIMWELLYVAQFFALEFFFRGFLLQPAAKTMGSAAVVSMMVPYVMIHFGKPWSETVVASVAGLVLGTVAVKTRSIWAGFFIHAAVALTMDISSILQK